MPTIAETQYDRDYRTACVLNQHRTGKLPDEYGALGAVLTLTHGWTYPDSRDFDDLVDTLAIAARMDEIRMIWKEDAREYLCKRRAEKACEHLARHRGEVLSRYAFQSLTDRGLSRDYSAMTREDVEILRFSRLGGQAPYRVGGAYLATLNV